MVHDYGSHHDAQGKIALLANRDQGLAVSIIYRRLQESLGLGEWMDPAAARPSLRTLQPGDGCITPTEASQPQYS